MLKNYISAWELNMRYLIFFVITISVFCSTIAITSAETDSKQEKKWSFIIEEKSESESDEIDLTGDLKEWFDKAQRRFDQKEYDDSIGWITRVIDKKPDFIPAYRLRGLAYIEKGKASKSKRNESETGYNKYIYEFNKALDNFNRIIELDPEYEDAYFYRGMSYRCLDHYPQPAIDSLTKYIKDFKKETCDAYIERGIAFYQRGFISESIDDYHRAIGLSPSNKDAYINLMKSYETTENYNDAIDYFGKLINRNPSNAMNWYYRGLCYSKLGDYSKARSDFQKALSIYPDYEDAKKMLGTANQ